MLVGGTALALYYGHRVSVDPDIFMNGGFDRQRMLDALIREFGEDLASLNGTTWEDVKKG